MRHLASLLLFSALLPAFAQEGKEPAAPATLVLTPITKAEPPSKVTVTGDHDVPPAPPSCSSLQNQARLDCLSREVLHAVRGKMQTSTEQGYANSEPIVIDLVINQFGDVKQISVKHAGPSEFPKQVNMAVYAMPKFIPATKGGAGVSATVSLSYPPSALFTPQE